MDRTEDRQGGQRIDDQPVVKGMGTPGQVDEKVINAHCSSPDLHSPGP